MNQNEIVSGRTLRRLLACNPFYLCSAALLLWGVYRLSNDPVFRSRETDQLAFNFGALQVYELLLVGTAILLGRRAQWYDSTLLVGLETGLLHKVPGLSSGPPPRSADRPVRRRQPESVRLADKAVRAPAQHGDRGASSPDKVSG